MKISIALISLLASANLTFAGTIDLYEGENASQNKIGTVQDTAGQAIKLGGKSGIDNDEAKSLTLNNVREGCVITLYDDPKGSDTKDDYCVIKVLKTAQQVTVKSFEHTYKDENVEVTFHKNNGLNGKVSHIKVE